MLVTPHPKEFPWFKKLSTTSKCCERMSVVIMRDLLHLKELLTLGCSSELLWKLY